MVPTSATFSIAEDEDVTATMCAELLLGITVLALGAATLVL